MKTGPGILLLLAAFFSMGASAQARNSPAEVEVEAAYLINLLRYTQWPAASFESAQSPYVITVVGSERAADGVRAIATSEGSIAGRAIEVHWIADSPGSRAAPFDSQQDAQAQAQIARSHLVFFHRSAGQVHRQLLSELARFPVLTVGDSNGFTAAGGMLGLVRADGRILIQANPGAIRNAGLVVSAKVLKLARGRRKSLQ